MGLVFVLIPGGRFEMGAQSEDSTGANYDPNAGDYMKPVHPVELSPFFLSKYELTQGQWERFAGINPSRNQPDELRGLHPVEAVNSGDADELCARLGLSLPSEAQWEYAARAGAGSVWGTGDSIESLARRVNVRGVPGGLLHHAPVGSYPPNAFGLCDLVGNVWEWCRDGFEHEFYQRSPLVDPVCEPVVGGTRILRGGGYGDYAVNARLAVRRNAAPNYNGGASGLRPARPLER
jgi:formylglycine-generating enzyme required for sulfatase activity